jgi:hypothetical protein
MNRARLIGIAIAALTVVGAGGVVVAGGLQNSPPQDARPSSDPVGDILRNAPPVETAPAGAPAPAAPVAIVPTTPVDMAGAPQETVADVAEAKEDAKVPAEEKIQEADTPLPRQRRRVAVIEAIDKITAERMRFEVVVGGRPVRFNDSLIFSAPRLRGLGRQRTGVGRHRLSGHQPAAQGHRQGHRAAPDLPGLDVRLDPRDQRPAAPDL